MGDEDQTTTIFEAAAKGDLQTVTHLVDEKGIDVNSVVAGGETALMKACANGHTNVIKFLIEKGAKVNQTDKWGYNALLWAVDRHTTDLDTIRYLVEHDANVNVKDKQKGYSPLHWTAYHGDLDMTKYLVEKGARVLEKSTKGELPIHLAALNNQPDLIGYFIDEESVDFDIFQAAEKGYPHAVRYFIERRRKAANSIDQRGWTVIHRAAFGGNLEAVKYLVEEKGVSVDSSSTGHNVPATPLKAAAEKGHANVVSYLVEKGADINAADINGKTALHAASEYGRTQVAKLLSDKGADVAARDVNGRTPLYWAADNGFLEIVKYFVGAKKANARQKDKYGNTLLHAAEWNGSLDVVKYLVEEKSLNVNAKDDEGNTPLLETIQRGKLAVFDYLLKERFADFRIADNWGRTCLHEAAIRGYMDAVKALVERGADINAKQRDGRTPLYYAADGTGESGGHLNVVKYFVDEKKADVRQKDNYGNTLLHAAEWNGALDVVKYLVEEKGLDVNAKDNDGNTPLAECIQRGKVDIAKYLESKGARRNRRRRDISLPNEIPAATNSAYRHYSMINCVAGYTKSISSALLTSSSISYHKNTAVDSRAINHSNAFDGLLILLGVGFRRFFGFSGGKVDLEGLLPPSESIERRIDPNATIAINESLNIF